MKITKNIFIFVLTALILFSACAFADEVEEAQEQQETQPKPPVMKVTTVGVIGNPNIASEYILNVVDT